MSFTLIPCDNNHWETLAAVGKQTFRDAFEEQTDAENFNLYLSTAFEKEVLLEEINDPKQFFWLVETPEGQVMGYIKLRSDRGEEYYPEGVKALEIQRIYLLKEFWNKGYGADLLGFCLQFAKKEGFSDVFLVVWYKNTAAQRFYLRHGFEEIGRKNFQFGNIIHNDPVLAISLV